MKVILRDSQGILCHQSPDTLSPLCIACTQLPILSCAIVGVMLTFFLIRLKQLAQFSIHTSFLLSPLDVLDMVSLLNFHLLISAEKMSQPLCSYILGIHC